VVTEVSATDSADAAAVVLSGAESFDDESPDKSPDES